MLTRSNEITGSRELHDNSSRWVVNFILLVIPLTMIFREAGNIWLTIVNKMVRHCHMYHMKNVRLKYYK